MLCFLYSAPTCSFCHKAKKWFRDERISFTEYDVSKVPRRADEMLRKSGQMGVPVIDVHGKIVVGFNQPEIVKALRH